jgi:putative transposase
VKKSRYTEEQITYALRQAESGTSVADVCRQLRDENSRLKRLVADLTLDKHILGEVIRKKL